jgi:predicted outer membrane repeat protein
MRLSKLTFFSMFILLALTISATAQTTYTVTTELDATTDGTLRWAVQQANLDSTADTIAFASNLQGKTITLTMGSLNLDTPATIQGPGASKLAISGDNKYQIFSIDNTRGKANRAEAWVISGLTFRDGWDSNESQYGGAIYANLYYSDDTLTVTDCVFDGNLGYGSGGAIFYANINSRGESNKRPVQVRKYTGQSAADIIGDMDARKAKGEEAKQAALREMDKHEKIEKKERPAKKERVREQRPASIGPRAETLFVRNCTFTDNRSYSDGYGGAIYHQDSDASIDNCIFSGNTSDYSGGAIYTNNASLTITRSTFTGNTALDNNGGTLYFDGSGYDLSMSDCTFHKNAAYYDHHGGALYVNNASAITATNCQFLENFAENGGAIYNGGYPMTLTNCGFYRNFAYYANGAVYQNSDCTLTGCVFTGNRTSWDGGAIRLAGGDATMDQCVFRANECMSYSGGAIDLQNGGTTIISDCQFSDNITAGQGGAIYANNSGTLTITGCCFANNTSRSDDGGALYLNNTSTTATWTIQNSTFSGNTAQVYYGDGGAIYWYGTTAGSTLALNSCTITGNSSFEYGGGLFRENNDANLTITNCIIADNTARLNGPDVYNNSTLNFTSGGYNLIGDGADSTGWIVSDQVGSRRAIIDPLLSPLANNGGVTLTHALLSNSTALNDGSTDLTEDQRGAARNDATDDIGAFESGATITQPKIEVLGNGLVIASGDMTPSLADNTDFSSANVNSSKVRTFTIRNTGTQNLTLNGSTPFVVVVGPSFNVSAAPASTIGAGGSTTFNITFTPTANGTHTGMVTIGSNDPAEPIYNFSIEGSGDGNHDDNPTFVTEKNVRRCGATGFEAVLFLLFMFLMKRLRKGRQSW